MSDNKAPVRVWINRFDMDGLGHPPRHDHAGEWNCYISAAAIRELVEEAERDSEKYGMPYGYTALHGMLKQLLEADR